MHDLAGQRSLVFILPSLAGGGAERVSVNLLNNFHASSVFGDVSLIVFDDIGPLRDLVSDGIAIHSLNRSRTRQVLPRLLGKIRQLRPDLLMSNMAHVNLAVLALKPFMPRRTRVIVREANVPLVNAVGSQRLLLKAGYRQLYKKADAIVCPSQVVADELTKLVLKSAPRPEVIFNPVDLESITARENAVLRTPGEGLRLVAVGRLTEQKGYDRLLDLLPNLPENTRLKILGQGPAREKLEMQIARLGLTQRVDLLGFVSDPWSHIRGSDALVMTSYWEGLPNVVLEALACGTRIVASPESGGISEIAKLAPDGVVVAEVGPPFLEALLKLQTGSSSVHGRPSMLPEAFSMKAVTGAYQRLFLAQLGGQR